MGFFKARKEAVQLVVCGLWRPVRLEGSEQDIIGHARQHGPPRSKRFFGLMRRHREPCDNLINALKLLKTSRRMVTVQLGQLSQVCGRGVAAG